MPIGSASIKRASGAINKSGEKSKKAAFSKNCALVEIEIEKIKFDGKLKADEDLKKSIKKYGVLHPVFVLREEDNFILVSGKSRISAAVELGITVVPAVVLSVEGNGAASAKKDIYVKKALPSVILTDEIAVSEDIREEKFNAIKSIGTDLPEYLL